MTGEREGLEGKDKRILQSAPHIAVPVTMHCGVYLPYIKCASNTQ